MHGPEEIEYLLKTRKPGDTFVTLMDGAEPQAVFLARERSAVIKYFGETVVEMRAGLFDFGPAAVLAVAFRLGHTVPRVYSFLLVGCSRNGADILRSLARQEYLPLYFYGDNCRRDRTFVALNRLQLFFRDTTAALHDMLPWSVDEFRAAEVKLAARCPTPEELWAALREN